jgi:hypothetical protein
MGCVSPVPPYDTIIENLGEAVIADAEVSFGEILIPGGYIAPGRGRGASMTPSLDNVRIPDRATVTWRFDGVLYRQEVEVASLLPARREGESYRIFFRILRDTVTVVVDTYTPYSGITAPESNFGPIH